MRRHIHHPRGGNSRLRARLPARQPPYNYDGYRNSSWIVVDYGSALVHIFMPDERRRYNLEELWSDGLITEIPDID